MNNNFKLTYTDYIRIHDLVYEYQDGDEKALLKLLDFFAGFLSAYMDLIKHGEYNLYNHSIKSFIGLFITDPQAKRYIDQHYHKPNVRKEIYKSVKLIKGIFSRYEKMDIQNDLTIVFMKMCKSYKDTNPSFHNYVLKWFHYKVIDYYRPLIRNSSVNNMKMHDDIETAEIEDTKQAFEIDTVVDDCNKHFIVKMANSLKIKDEESIYADGHINTNWVLGLTCSDEFKELSNYERELIVEYYVNDKSDQDIADRYGVCRATVNRKKQSVKRKLENSFAI